MDIRSRPKRAASPLPPPARTLPAVHATVTKAALAALAALAAVVTLVLTAKTAPGPLSSLSRHTYGSGRSHGHSGLEQHWHSHGRSHSSVVGRPRILHSGILDSGLSPRIGSINSRSMMRQRMRSSGNKISTKKVTAATRTWQWRSYNVSWTEVAPKGGQNVLFLHGFGVSSKQYRDNLPATANEGYNTYAIDLLGFGKSDKPATTYSIELWSDLVNDFIEEVIGGPTFIVGNSIGSLIALASATSRPQLVEGLVILNCASGMNSKMVSREDVEIEEWQFYAADGAFTLIDLILKSPLGNFLYDNLKGPETIDGILRTLYQNPTRVDRALVNSICEAANDPGAFETFVAVLTGEPGVRPERLIRSVEQPTLILWGEQDGVTPIDGPVGGYFQKYAKRASEKNIEFERLDGVGHCLQDDKPELINQKILEWLASRSLD